MAEKIPVSSIEGYEPSSSPTADDKGLTPTPTVSDGDSSGIAISNTPVGYTTLEVDGIQQTASNGDKTKDYYWSTDGGTTALDLSALVTGAIAYWNGSIAGFQLNTNMIVNINYNL